MNAGAHAPIRRGPATSRGAVIGLAAAVGLLLASPPARAPGAGPVEPIPRADAPTPAGDDDEGPRPDLKVAFWFREANPLGTFRYRVYDVRKGQYTGAVDAWLGTMRARYPGYAAYVRDVDLAAERGETEREKLAAVVLRELHPFLVAQAASTSAAELLRPGGPDIARGDINRDMPPYPTARGRSPGGRIAGRPSFGMPSFPVPYPYPRPHP